MCERASKKSSDLKNYAAPEPRPLVLKILDPPLHVYDHEIFLELQITR